MASPSRDKTVYNFNVVRWLEKHHRKKKISKHDLDAAKIVELRGIFEALDDDDSGSKATCGAFLKYYHIEAPVFVFAPTLLEYPHAPLVCDPHTRDALSLSVGHPSFKALVLRVRVPPLSAAAKRSSPRSTPTPIAHSPSICLLRTPFRIFSLVCFHTHTHTSMLSFQLSRSSNSTMQSSASARWPHC